MEEFDSNIPRDDIFSKSVRAGKRTYFFDVKSTRANELYLTITESKRRFNQQTGKFFYEKHKLFLYQEDFDKFREALETSFKAVEELQGEITPQDTPPGRLQSGSGPGEPPAAGTPAGEEKEQSKDTAKDEEPDESKKDSADQEEKETQ